MSVNARTFELQTEVDKVLAAANRGELFIHNARGEQLLFESSALSVASGELRVAQARAAEADK